MTEEELAASLGLIESSAMKTARYDAIDNAPFDDDEPKSVFLEALNRYQQYGEEIVNRMSNIDYPKGQIALILLTASVRRDIGKHNTSYQAHRIEDLNDALDYAFNMGFKQSLLYAMQELLTS